MQVWRLNRHLHLLLSELAHPLTPLTNMGTSDFTLNRFFKSNDMRRYSAEALVRSVAASSDGRGLLEVCVRLLELILTVSLECLNAVTAVQVHSNLFICLYKHFKFFVQVSILGLQDVDVLLESHNFNSETGISVGDSSVRELNIVIFLASNGYVILPCPCFALQVENNSLQVFASLSLSLLLSEECESLLVASVEVSLRASVIILLSCALVLEHGKLSLCGFESLNGASQVEVATLRDLGQFVGTVVGLGQLVVGGADFLGLTVILTLTISVELTETLDLIDILVLFLLQLGYFEEKVVNFLAELVTLVGLLCDIALETGDVDFLSCDLIACSPEVLLYVADNASLLIEEESEVVHFLLEADDGDGVGVVLHAELVILQQLLVLQVSVLGLDRVELVAQGQEVLVALLDFKDLRLQLGDQEILLVGCKVHAIVVLQRID